MAKPMTIAVDAMSGDHGADVAVRAAISYLRASGAARILLVGDSAELERLTTGIPSPIAERLATRHASQVVTMDVLPSRAVRRNMSDSSMRVAIEMVKSGEADACVSAGNTGALMALAYIVLRTLPLVDRPAIIAPAPSLHGRTYLLDLGANVDCSAEQLYQFAVMGSELVRAVDRIEAPRVGLLNVGQEEIKGNEQVKRAHDLLTSSALNYVNYVEGDDIFLGDVDVIVSDGFVGNVALKSSEGAARYMSHMLRAHFTNSWATRLAAIASRFVLKRFKDAVDPRNFNGASLLGLNGIVVKSHGSADEVAFEKALNVAEREIRCNIPRLIGEQVARHLVSEPKGAMA